MKQTDSTTFQEHWEEYLKNCSFEDIQKALENTSPHHPNDNMVWLHDRLLLAIAERGNG